MIKAIETRYAGCRFRSRLEARWAVFMDAMQIRWEYEPQGFELHSGSYLPDFYLPGFPTHCYRPGVWLEIKGKPASRIERQLATELSTGTDEAVFLLEGDVPREPTCGCQGTLDPIVARRHITNETQPDETGALMAWYVRPAEVSGTDCLFHGDGIASALAIARSARFEHGENG